MTDDGAPHSPWLEDPAAPEPPNRSESSGDSHGPATPPPVSENQGQPQGQDGCEPDPPAGPSPSIPRSDEHLDFRIDEDGAPPDGTGDQFDDDFDTFEEGAAAEGDHDDFDDFDDAFEEPTAGAVSGQTVQETEKPAPGQPPGPAPPPLLDFSSIHSLSDLLTSASEHLDAIFPNASKTSSASVPKFDSPSNSSIFMTERSHSLWSQLVAPPPLQPPNWTKSRIRRLFLVSLGVPVDLDEILPASKQKKLVLPSMNLDPSRKSTASDGARRSGSRPKKDGQRRSSTSLDSRRSSSHARGPRRRGLPPEPSLDLSAVHRLCATTDAALDGFTDEEMQAHVQKLQEMTVRASEVLEYWLKRRDGQMGEKEAFEGVIENLVKHARQVRK